MVGQTIQWSKWKMRKGQTSITQKTKDRATCTPLKSHYFYCHQIQYAAITKISANCFLSIIFVLCFFLLLSFRFVFISAASISVTHFSYRRRYRMFSWFTLYCRGRRGRDHMVVGFTTTYATSAYHHYAVSSNLTQARRTRYNIMW